MFARVISSHIVAGKRDEAARHWQEAVVPNTSKQPGFRGAYLMSEPEGTRSIVITLWETEADAKRVDTSGSYQQAVNAMNAFLMGQPTVEIYEVNVQV